MHWLLRNGSSLRRWFRTLNLKGTKSPARFRPQIEELEDRAVPSAASPDYDLLHPANSSSTIAAYTPQQLEAAYGVNSISFTGGISGTGAGQTIAIVDAYHDPNALADLETFDARYGLTNPPSFTQLNQNGQSWNFPGVDPTGKWELEESLDIEYAHALAPAANIVLVEAADSSTANLFAAVQTAASLSGVSVVSMSWGTQGGFSNETSYDNVFNVPGITFVASTGDNGSPASYPAESPYVVAVGGTSLTMANSTTYGNETAWSDSGGGLSSYESRPSYQDGVSWAVGSARGTPDVAFDADPGTGVSVYDSFDVGTTGGPWFDMGGTSLGAPSWAALIAIADQGRASEGLGSLSSTETLDALYSLPSSDFNQITSGSNGGYQAGAGYNLVTGLGTPIANLLVPDLAGVPSGNANTAGGAAAAVANPAGAPTAGTYDVADVAGEGVMLYNESTGAWTDITPATATSVAVDAQGDVVAAFAGDGVWLYQNSTGNWQQLAFTDASQVDIAGNGVVAAAFASGVYRYQSGSGWQHLTSDVASSVAIDANGNVAASFSSAGVWRYENATGWVQLTSAAANDLGIDNGIVVAAFNSGVFRYQDSTGWQQLTTSAASSVAVDASGDVVAAFSNQGVWNYQNSQGWTQISTSTASQVAMGPSGEILAAFGGGVYSYGGGDWVNLLAGGASSIGIGT